MRRRAPSLIALAGVVTLMLAAAPAVALSPFGSTVEVVESSCRFEDSTGDAVMGSDGLSVTSDSTGVYLLYQARNGSLYLTKRTSGGVFTAGRRLSSVKEDGPV